MAAKLNLKDGPVSLDDVHALLAEVERTWFRGQDSGVRVEGLRFRGKR